MAAILLALAARAGAEDAPVVAAHVREIKRTTRKWDDRTLLLFHAPPQLQGIGFPHGSTSSTASGSACPAWSSPGATMAISEQYNSGLADEVFTQRRQARGLLTGLDSLPRNGAPR